MQNLHHGQLKRISEVEVMMVMKKTWMTIS